MAKSLLISAICFVCLTGYISACANPKVETKSFTTQDATIVANVGFIAEFTIQCESGLVSNLYAQLEDGNIVPVAQVGKNSYQVSWAEDTKTAQRGTHNVRIFDEEGFSALRKALRSNEDTAQVPEFLTVSVHHPGAYSGPYFRSEFVAVVISLALAYFAINTRSKIVA